MRVQQAHCSLLLQVQSSSSLELFFRADRVAAVLGTRAQRYSRMCSFADTEANTWEG